MDGTRRVRRNAVELLLPPGAEFPRPLQPRQAGPRCTRGGGQRLQRRPHIGANSRVEAAIHAEFLRVDVELNEFRRRRKEARAAERQPVIDALADHQKQIGLAEHRVDGVVECGVGIAHAKRVVVGDHAARHRDRIEGQLRVLDECLQLGSGIAPPHAASRDHHGALGAAQQGDRALYPSRVRWSASFTRLFRNSGCGGFGAEHVHRDGEVHRGAAPRIGFIPGTRQIEGNLPGGRRLGGKTGHGPHGGYLVDILKRLPVGQRAGAAAADGNQRAARQVRRGDAGDGVGVPGPSRHQRHRGAAVEPRPGIGRVRDSGFVPHVHDADAAALAGRKHFVEMVAHQREDGIDTPLRQGLDE